MDQYWSTLVFFSTGLSMQWHWAEFELIDFFEVSIKNLSNKVLSEETDGFDFENFLMDIPGNRLSFHLDTTLTNLGLKKDFQVEKMSS